MKLLIKNARILDARSLYQSQMLDLFIEDGIIRAIAANVQADAPIFDAKGACVSCGWMDVGVQACDPGMEYREDLRSAAAAAAAGGYTAIAVLPNTQPVIDSKSEILYIKQQTQGFLVDCYPIGAISDNCAGKDISEMLDMHVAGAVAFSDGLKSVQHNSLMIKALQYVSACNGILIHQPLDATIAPDGQMHEGLVSTMLGMKGIPALAETMMVQRDLQLLAYTQGRLHLANISTAESVAHIREAKAKGLQVTASVAALHLMFSDEAIAEFDANFKVMPPLRSEKDRQALIAGLQDDTIDFISSNHIPVDEDGKKREFPYADFGAIGLETAFGVACTALQEQLPLVRLIEKLYLSPRKILNLELPEIAVGAMANLTIFDPTQRWTVQESAIRSKSSNTPLIGHELTGRVLAIINNRQSEIFHHP